ncbi:segregation and condensation protein B [Entomoplasma freundtii]|uniref:Chromosome condensation and segregation factor B n=1 Tax=Entomoplasma freundtii TaxID=74700 RepID=A0A2K8NRV4_9MOLU|nr:SMC-Scp complex subunit ScpB [Entomoplasma freundtii]ATZ16539.1 chromosome condensation and segregation factor B [Entomoplasma freundtii]TDY58295.1 segregation and condensation protein B [Entomoplasma freundtii]
MKPKQTIVMNKTSQPEILAIIEALLFLNGDEGLSLKTLETMLENEKPSTIKQALNNLQNKYRNDSSSAFAIQEFATNKYRLHTKQVLYPFLQKSEAIQSQNRLSITTIEVLAIIAYQGPITRAEIDLVRQLDSTYQLAKLKELRLIQVVGRKPETRANLYQVTDSFYKLFNLQDLATDLPEIDYEAILRTQKQNDELIYQSHDAEKVGLNLNDSNTMNQLFQSIDDTFIEDLGEN